MEQARDARHAPYASAASFRAFLDRIRLIPPPAGVDKNLLIRLDVAPSNEWSLLSALKYLRIIDERGVPSAAYHRLRTDAWQDALRQVVQEAYRPLMDVGGASMPVDGLENYFRVTSSSSQARSAARFFRELRDMAGMAGMAETPAATEPAGNGARGSGPSQPAGPELGTGGLLQTKLRVLELMPRGNGTWSREDFIAVYDRILAILRNLDSEV
ncbi:MAG: DUF5343 domain-containing protein [Chloroflexota bacterium]